MILIFMGPPGAGKGTQSKLVEKEFNIPQISTGDILREAVANQTEMGKKAKQFMDAGDLVPDSVVIGIIADKIQTDECVNGFILDGFPRTLDQAKALDVLLKGNHKDVSHVISFEVADEELTNRLLERAKIEGRADDNIDSIKNRLDVFKQKTQPLIDYYRATGKLVSIDGLGEIEEIFARVKKAIG